MRTELWPGAPGESAPGDPVGEETTDSPQPDDAPGICADFTLNYTSAPATVLILVDASSSMNARAGNSTRWGLVGEALFDPSDGLLTRLSTTVRFGLALYSSLDGFVGGTCPAIEMSNIDIDQGEELESWFDGASPLAEGDTPTGEAIEFAIDRLLSDEGVGPRYLIVITDGEPDTCAVPDPQQGQPEALLAAERAYESGINTFVVGVSSDIGAAHLQEMSNVARGVRREAVFGRDDDAVEPIQASEQQGELAGQIQGILADVRNCTLAVADEVSSEGIVELDGRALSPGVDYSVQGQSLVLFGAACEEILTDAEQLVVRLQCADARAE